MTNVPRRAAAAASILLLTACAGSPPKPAPAPSAPRAAAPAPASGAASAGAPASASAAAAAAVVAPKGRRRTLWGGVASVDAAARIVVVTDHGGYEHRFRVAADAALTKGGDGSALALSDLSSGARVRVSYVDDVAVAVHLRVAATP
jgi:hypothetical protein